MAFKPNYRQQRNERSRSKEQKKLEKLQKREEDAAKRKGAPGEGDVETTDDEDAPDAGTNSANNPETSDGPQENQG
ncbi:hypothetical protein RUR49_01355 [Pseudoxanthobacter sp. M-2]|uniref:hypothetical protein n=1 Tax=Pseudoxanthobacter sp. M-2 TaxID=3078754 RepID=UPI0038FC8F07